MSEIINHSKIHNKFSEMRDRTINQRLLERGYKIVVDYIPSGVRDLMFAGRWNHDAVEHFLKHYGNVKLYGGK